MCERCSVCACVVKWFYNSVDQNSFYRGSSSVTLESSVCVSVKHSHTSILWLNVTHLRQTHEVIQPLHYNGQLDGALSQHSAGRLQRSNRLIKEEMEITVRVTPQGHTHTHTHVDLVVWLTKSRRLYK